MFVNRTRELQFLESRFTSGQAELIVLYGSRCVDKTELLDRRDDSRRRDAQVGRRFGSERHWIQKQALFGFGKRP